MMNGFDVSVCVRQSHVAHSARRFPEGGASDGLDDHNNEGAAIDVRLLYVSSGDGCGA